MSAPHQRPVASYSIVVPTIGRASLTTLLTTLGQLHDLRPERVVVVDDRPGPDEEPLDLLGPHDAGRAPVVVRSFGHGPAAARNAGWRATDTGCEWVVFLDDDVVPGPGWAEDLHADLAVPGDVWGSQAQLDVPLPDDRRPADWERGTAGLAHAAWITADMAYRRPALELVEGFDERFPRAFREDADLALRVQRRGGRLVRGRRRTTHPVRPADRWVSVRQQAGNADDALMRRLHGAGWRTAAQAPAGRRRWHVLTSAAGVTAALATVTGHRRTAALAVGTWATGTAAFAWARVVPGPRTGSEVSTMLATSIAIPPVATWHWLSGTWRHRHAGPWPSAHAAPAVAGPSATEAAPIRAVLFDRDGTLVRDVPYNGHPDAVRPVEGGVQAVARLREHGIATGVITNQSGIGRGLLTRTEVEQVNARVDQVFGGFGVWVVCPHTDEDGCECRKPGPGMVRQAAAALGVPPAQTLVVGDIGADMGAAAASGAQAVMVPAPATRPEEVAAAPAVAATLVEVVQRVIDEQDGGRR
jgi:histidinol-phosphate phosphatase family protein